MKRSLKIVLVLLVLAVAVAGLVFAYLQMSEERKTEAEREKPVAAKSRVAAGPTGEPILTLDGEDQKNIALQTQPLKPARLNSEINGYGRVLDPSPLAALVTELASAQASAMASEKEFERLKLLSQQKNASDRALQAAEAIARRDQIAVESARTRMATAWGKAISERPDLGGLVQSLVSLESALVRIDLPVGERREPAPAGTRIAGLGEEKPVPAQYLGPAPSVDPQMQGQAFLFLVKASSSRLVPGRAVSGFLQLQGEPVEGWIVPDSAVVRHAAHGWIYVQTGENTFTRREIALDHRMEDGWFVSKALSEKVVVSGAQALLSEEQKNQIKMFD
jgi:hypothetical protein